MKDPRVPTTELVGPAGRVIVNKGSMEAEYRRNGYTDPGAAPAAPAASKKKKTSKKASSKWASSKAVSNEDNDTASDAGESTGG